MKKLSDFITANPKLVLGGFCLLLLIVLLLKDCTPKERIEEISTPVIDTTVSVESRLYEQKWKDSIAVLNKQLGEVKKDAGVVERKLKQSQNEVKTWVVKYESARKYYDTAGALMAADSLIVENFRLNMIIDEEREISRQKDSLYDVALAAANEVAIKQTQFASEMRLKLAESIKQTNEITNERNQIAEKFNKQNKKLRGSQGKSKILAGAVILFGGILIVK